MEALEHTCCFTGHRPDRLPWLQNPGDLRTQALERMLWERICFSYREGYTCFLSGMARGVDLLCARLVLRLREEEPEVRLIPVLPYPGQAGHWPKPEREEHRKLLYLCREELVVVSPAYTRACFALRNRYLVDHAAKIIGVYDGQPNGGTWQTLHYAKERGREMELLLRE